jgi:hypothetical protein
MAVLVTGSAGFIGSSLCNQLLSMDQQVIGVDSLSNYYSTDLKKLRNETLCLSKNFKFLNSDICDKEFVNNFFKDNSITTVYHLAAQAGVRLSLSESNAYVDSNIQGFLNIVEKSIEYGIDKFVYASSSSVYGNKATIPFSEEEINLTVRSYTHGYDLFHPHKLVVWHSTMREERANMLKWDDDAKFGVDWFQKQEYARKKIRVLLGTEEDPTIDLTGYNLGTVRSLKDFEKYAGFHFKRKAVQKYTLENNYPPNPLIEDDELWEQSFMGSFYHLVTVYPHDFPRKDYKHILVAFDDENGNAVNHKYIDGQQLEDFMNKGQQIHYEEFFLTDKTPKRVVFWGFSEEVGWAERIEYQINN